MSSDSRPLNPQNLSLTGLAVIISITEAIISSHSWQGICKAIWFVHLLTQLYHYHPIIAAQQWNIFRADATLDWTLLFQHTAWYL